MFKFNNAIGYIKEANLLGEISGVDIRNGLYIIVIEDGDGEEVAYEASFDVVEVLEEVFKIHDGISVYDKDVLGHINGKMYQIERIDDEHIRFHELNSNLETVSSGETIKIDEKTLDEIEQVLDLQGNYYELLSELPQKPEFTVEIVKDYNGEYYTYYYALNNKQKEEIDLVEVTFLGGYAFGEYSRRTVSYEEYNKLKSETGKLLRVEDSEFINYLTGATHELAGAGEFYDSLDDAMEDLEEEKVPFKSNADFDSLPEEVDDSEVNLEEFLKDDYFKVSASGFKKLCTSCHNALEDCDCLWN